MDLVCVCVCCSNHVSQAYSQCSVENPDQVGVAPEKNNSGSTKTGCVYVFVYVFVSSRVYFSC